MLQKTGKPIEPSPIEPKFSIITVILNDAEGFQRTAESIIQQSCKDFEWIVIDGGSNFETRCVINSYRYHIDKFVSEPDDGIYDAMMKGDLIAVNEPRLSFMLNWVTPLMPRRQVLKMVAGMQSK